MSIPIPDEAYQLGETHQMGQIIAGYRINWRRIDWIHFYFVTIVGSLYELYFLYLLYSILTGTYTINYTFLTLTILIVYAITIFIISSKRGEKPFLLPTKRHMRVFVYQEGFIRLIKDKPDIVRWQDIEQTKIKSTKYMDNRIEIKRIKIYCKENHNLPKTMSFNENLVDVHTFATIVDYKYRKAQQETLENRQMQTKE